MRIIAIQFASLVVMAAMLAALISIGLMFVPPVQAALPAPPEVVACAPINTAGLIVVYRCSPEQGAPYLINSLGFMMIED